MHNDLQTARAQLAAGDLTCVIRSGDREYTSRERGVKPLVRWLTEGADFRGFSAADKVVGKATAYLYCLLGVKAVYAHVMSIPAAQVLAQNGIAATQGKLVENIINRQGTGICPFEAAVQDAATPQDALKRILAKMEEMHICLF